MTHSDSGLCAHGMAGFCPDCPPDRIDVRDEAVGARTAVVRGCEVLRIKEDGAYDWATVHLTRRAARKAAALYEQTGRVKGRKP